MNNSRNVPGNGISVLDPLANLLLRWPGDTSMKDRNADPRLPLQLSEIG